MAKVTHIPCNGNFKVTYTYGDYNPKLNITSDKRHWGIDLSIEDKKVFSASKGKVIFAGWNNQGYGNLVMVEDGTYRYYYAHLKKINVKTGDEITYTTQIGLQGATGNVTGEHLHFEMRKNGVAIDPTIYMGIKNELGNYNSYDYIVEEDDEVQSKFTTGRYKVTAKEGLNIREKPTVNSNKLYYPLFPNGAYPCGTVFDVFEISGDWGKSPAGWLNLNYAEKIG